MNAGGHGSDIAESLIDVTTADLKAPAGVIERTLVADEVGLRFRGSALGPNVVVLEARLQLAPGETELIIAGIAIYMGDPNMAATILPRSG